MANEAYDAGYAAAIADATVACQGIHDEWKSDDGPEAKLQEVDRIAGRLAALQCRDAVRDLFSEDAT